MGNTDKKTFNINLLRCPFCKKKLLYSLGNNAGYIVSCGLHKFPIVNGIIYLKIDMYAQKAIKSIKINNYLKSEIALLNLRRKMLIPMLLLLNVKTFLSLSNFIHIIRLFGYDKSWSEYLLNRSKKDSYKPAKLIYTSLKKDGTTLDFGCGIGQFLPIASSMVGGRHLFALDSSFVNLMIARRFYADPGTLLICSDGEVSLPFGDKSLNSIIATDSFHYLSHKKSFIDECGRILVKGGKLNIIQTISSSRIVFGNIKGIRPETLSNILKTSKFHNINFLSGSTKINDKASYNTIATK